MARKSAASLLSARSWYRFCQEGTGLALCLVVGSGEAALDELQDATEILFSRHKDEVNMIRHDRER